MGAVFLLLVASVGNVERPEAVHDGSHAQVTDNYRARTYDPSLGRFLQRDPIGIWGDGINFGNGYGYVGQDPGNGRDPEGLKAYFIGGLGDSGGIMGNIRDHMQRHGIVSDSMFFRYDEVNKIVCDILSGIAEACNNGYDDRESVVLIGHSWGGASAAQVAEQLSEICGGVPIDLMVTLDPVSNPSYTFNSRPGNVNKWSNVYPNPTAATAAGKIPVAGYVTGAVTGLAGLIGGLFGANYNGSDWLRDTGGAWTSEGRADRNIGLNGIHHESADSMIDELLNEIQNASGKRVPVDRNQCCCIACKYGEMCGSK